MGTEIERKFLVDGEINWSKLGSGKEICQGYAYFSNKGVLRIRVINNNRALLTLKGALKGISRPEFEYEIPLQEARSLLEIFCGKRLIRKTRFQVTWKQKTFEIDRFKDANEGLILAEVELEREDEDIPLPPWAGPEVSSNSAYFNSNLALNPYCNWN